VFGQSESEGPKTKNYYRHSDILALPVHSRAGKKKVSGSFFFNIKSKLCLCAGKKIELTPFYKVIN